ncbi:MAG: aldehyde dehydrogenase family protein [Bacteroidales bacterium]
MTTLDSIEDLRKRQAAFFDTGKTRDLSFRKDALIRLRSAVRKHEKDIYLALKSDLNKSSFEAYGTETGIVLHELSTMIHNLRRWAAGKIVTTPLFAFPSISRVVPEPFGRVLIISPWNYPFQLPLVPLTGAIAAGNVAIIRQSASSPAINVIIRKIIGECFSDEHVAVVDCPREVANEMVNLKWDLIFFTGSTDVGRMIYTAAAKNLTPVILELGGKSPVIIDRTASLRVAAKRILWGKTINAGQTCIAPDYLFVHKEVKEKFLSVLKEEIHSMYGDDPLSNDWFGRIISEKAFRRILSYTEGARIIAGGQHDLSRLLIGPTVIEATESDKCMQEEIFGPVLPVMEYDDLDKVISFINSREKPLALYVFTTDRTVKKKVLRFTSSGACLVNDVVMHIANKHLPFGGVGSSGLGRYHGKESFRAFSNLKASMHTSSWIDVPIKYPPYGRKERIMKLFLR